MIIIYEPTANDSQMEVEMTKQCRHEFETKDGYPEDIICQKCQTIMNGTLTLTETAKYLHVHYNTVYRWVVKGSLPSIKLGGRYRIRQEDLDEFTKVKR